MTGDYHCHCWDKCPCDEKFKALTQTLATERDKFGKREIELMQENRELREALEKIAGIGLGGEGTLMAREFLLAKSGDRHER